MSYTLSKRNLRMVAGLSLIAFLHGIIGCSYYQVSKRVENPNVPTEAKALAAKGGDPRSSLAQFGRGTEVIIQLNDRTMIRKQFIASDGTHVYLGTRAVQDQQVALKDISYIKKAKSKEYFIVHHGFQVWHLKYVSLNDDQNEIRGEIEPLTDNHKAYLTTEKKVGKANRYKPDKLDPIHEVHLYTSTMNVTNGNFVAIPLSSIGKIEIYKEDGGTTGVNIFLSVVVIVGVMAIIVATTKSSCPFVYVRNDSTYAFVGEIFGGAIYPSLERDDYLPLGEINPVGGAYQVKISNELLERQYTDLAELILVDHDDNTSALIDQGGVVHIVGKPETPLTAVDGSGINRMASILQRDSSSYLFNETQPGQEEVRSLILNFKKPVNARNGKLILRAKNSYWLDFVYGKFTEQFGTAYDRFIAKQKKEPASKLLEWSKEQNIPLTVQVETTAGWRTVDQFTVVGPLASRDMVMPIDLSESTGEYANIRLESGYMFWEVDYAAMDFSDQPSPMVTSLSPSTATDEHGMDVRSTLVSADHVYLSQPEIGNEAIVTYRTTEPRGKRTVFLHSRGYYEHIRSYKNKPNWAEIYSFRKKGAFGLFAKKHLEILQASQELLPVDAVNQTGVISN